VFRVEQLWHKRGIAAILLWPLSILYRLIIALRRLAYRFGLKTVHPASLPVIVVGNLTVGGTGKTPLCAYLVNHFKEAGWRPGIVSRGYGGQRHEKPYLVTSADSPAIVGDEPMMLSQQTDVPVCVCVKRALAVEHLAVKGDVDIVFADDGLQHLAMARGAEVVVIDGKRGFGNGWMLPAGPLREPLARLRNADLIAIQSTDAIHDTLTKLAQNAKAKHRADNAGGSKDILNNTFSLRVSHTLRLSDDKQKPLGDFSGQTVTAMAGIGHPERFFEALRRAGLTLKEIPRPDHHAYTLADLPTDSTSAVLVTSKDAVKLRALGKLPIEIYEVVTQLVANDSLQQHVMMLERTMSSRAAAKRA